MYEPAVLVDAGCRLGESVLWHSATKTLIWLDLFERHLFIYEPQTKSLRRLLLPLAAPLGSAVAADDPGSVLVTHPGGVACIRLLDGSVSSFADPEAGRDGIAYNDCKVDRFGRLWLGTSDLLEKEPRGALWCLEQSGRITLCDAGFVVANGPAFSPDGRTLYFNDTFARRTLCYDISPDDPRPRNRRVFRTYDETEGFPDGLTVDEVGCLWVAHWDGGRLSRLSPTGEHLLAIPLPCKNVTAVCFGGNSYDTIFVSTAREGDAAPTAGHVFDIRTPAQGMPEPVFRLPR